MADYTPAKVYAPTRADGAKRWTINIVDTAGMKHAKHYKTQSSAKQEYSRTRNQIKSAREATRAARHLDVPQWDGSLAWFTKVLAAKTREVALGGGKEARGDLKAIASAGLAAKQLHDTADLERQIAEAEALLEEMQSTDNYGTRREWETKAA